MALILTFLALGILAAVLLLLLAQAAWWQALLLGLGVFLLAHPLGLLGIYLASLTVDRDKPLEKQVPLCRAGTAQVLGLVCVYCGIRPRVLGLEKLPRDRRFFLVCNHRSGFDPCLMLYKLRGWNVSFIAKPAILNLPVIGRIGHAAGILAIDRENDRNALRTILQAADYMKRDLCSMAVYPEGTRTRSGEMLPFHPGSFKAAQRAGVPLVISAIRGTEHTRQNVPFRRTKAVFEILEVLEPEQVKAMSTNELADYSRDRIAAWLEQPADGGQL